jgi:O-antigen/teichoic acid export membrane protein
MSHDYKRITKQLGVSYFFNILTFIFTPALIFLLTRTLSVKEFGVYSILSVTILVLFSFLEFGTSAFIITKFSGFNYSKRSKSFFSILAFKIFVIVLLSFILLIPAIYMPILEYLRLTNYLVEFCWSWIIVMFSVVFFHFSFYLTAERKIEFCSFISFFYNCAWIICLIIFYLIFRSYNLRVIFGIWFVGVLISLLIILFYLRKEIFYFIHKIKGISFSLLKQALSFSLPIIPITVSSWLLTIADRYMISYFKGAELVGIYSLSYSLVLITLTFSSVIWGVLYPHICKAWNDKKNHQILLNASLKYRLMIVIPAMVGLLVLRDQIITLVAGVDYLAGSSVILFLIPFPLFAVLIDFYCMDLFLHGKTKLMASVYVGGAIFNIILNYFLIPKFGINGASLATTTSYFFIFLAFYFISRKQFSLDFKFLKVFKIIIASLLMGFVLYLINPQVYLTKWLSILLGVIIYGLFLFLFQIFGEQERSILKSFMPNYLQKIFK